MQGHSIRSFFSCVALLVFAASGCAATSTPEGEWSGDADCPPSRSLVTVHFDVDEVDADLARGDAQIRWEEPDDPEDRWRLNTDLELRVAQDEPSELSAVYSECIGPYRLTDWPCPLDGGLVWDAELNTIEGRMLLPASFEDYYGWFDCSLELERESGL